jgi:hypothetical protein
VCGGGPRAAWTAEEREGLDARDGAATAPEKGDQVRDRDASVSAGRLLGSDVTGVDPALEGRLARADELGRPGWAEGGTAADGGGRQALWPI